MGIYKYGVTPSSIDAEQQQRANELVRNAQRDLGELSNGQRRDLLADNTDWSTEIIRRLVGNMKDNP